MTDNIDHHLDVCHYEKDNTPPTPAEMPKPDFIGQEKGEPSEYEAYYIIDGESDIQRFAAEQHARAERAEKSAAALDEALCVIFDDSERFCRERDKLQAENERLREALETIGNGDVDYKNGQYEAQSLANELYAIRAFADAALHPTTKGDEDE